MGVVAREVKKLAVGLLWKDRTGADLKAVLDAPSSVEVSLSGCRIGKAISYYLYSAMLLRSVLWRNAVPLGEVFV